MKKRVLLLLFVFLIIIIGVLILSRENREISENGEIPPASNAYLLSDTGTLLACYSDRKEAIVKVDDSDNRFLYDEITLIFTGASNEYKINSSMVGEKIKFYYFSTKSTNQPTLEIYLINKLEK